MSFKEAYEYAMERSESFRKHDEAVKMAEAKGEQSPCLSFTVEPGESFYYGFDGVEMHKGKHTRRRTSRLIETDSVLIIL